MKNICLLAVIVLVANGLFAQQTFTAEQARETLLSPEKLDRACLAPDTILDRGHYEEAVLAQLFNLVKGDQLFLRQVYAKYAANDHNYVASTSIEKMKAGDDAYFKKIFEEAKGDHIYHIRTAALLKINDLAYVKKLISEESEVDQGGASPAPDFLLMRGSELYQINPKFVDSLAESSNDSFVRRAAIATSQNKALLERYANLSKEDCDQYRYSFRSVEQQQAYLNGIFREAAAERLKALK